MLQDWRVRRSQAGRRRLALEDARQQVTFAAEWWNAPKLVADSPAAVKEATSRTATWLEQASAQVSGSEIPAAEEKRRITFRRLLLFYPLQGITANIIRGIFYFSVGVLIAGVGGTISDALESRTRHIIGDLLFLALVALVALGLRFWAVSAQNPTGKERKLRPETIRRALLFYRLGGFNASLVRIVFYTYTILAVALISFQPWGNLKLLPNNIGLTIAFAGFGVGFRHWAAALGTAGKDNATKRQLPSGASVQGPETSPIANQWWQRIPDHGPDQGPGL